LRGLPLGLAHKLRLRRAVSAGQAVGWDDVEFNERQPAVAFRREMESVFGQGATA
jgi:predicted homoserine dehydrogenase-like protein